MMVQLVLLLANASIAERYSVSVIVRPVLARYIRETRFVGDALRIEGFVSPPLTGTCNSRLRLARQIVDVGRRLLLLLRRAVQVGGEKF